MYGYIRGVLQHRSCPVKVYLKTVETDKDKMVRDLKSSHEETLRNIHSNNTTPGQEIPVNPNAAPSDVTAAETSLSLPPLVLQDDLDSEGWTVFEKPVMFLFAGKGPYVSRDLMQFPVSHPDDGYLDVAIQEMVCQVMFISGPFTHRARS